MYRYWEAQDGWEHRTSKETKDEEHLASLQGKVC